MLKYRFVFNSLLIDQGNLGLNVKEDDIDMSRV